MKNPLALIIEDDEQLADIFAIALTDAEFEVEIIHNGQAALERLAIVKPEVVVLDLHLPQISGRAILRHIRAEPSLAATRIMLTTADPILAESLEDEVDLVLIKPIGYVQLRDLAKRLRPQS